VQALADVQVTAAKLISKAPAGLGVDWTFHDLPFHRSANVTP
jgi:hypothetical protein